MQSRDRRLHLVFTHLTPPQRPGDQAYPLDDERPVPQGAVLLGEGDQPAVGTAASRAPGVGEQHEREEAGDLGILGQAGPDAPGQPDGLARQVGAGQVRAAAAGVALVEQQVEDVQHQPEAFRALVGRRERERLARCLDLGLGPADPLGHGRLGNEERGGDLARGQAADRAERERDGQRGRERRMAAQDHEDQRVVAPRGLLVRAGHRPGGGQLLPAAARVVAAVLVGQPAGGHPDEPAQRAVGPSLGGPCGGGGNQRLLHGVLGVGEVAVTADERTEDLRRKLAQQVLEARARGHSSAVTARGHSSGSGALSTSRTSIGCRIGTPPGPGAADARAATSMARAAVSTSSSR